MLADVDLLRSKFSSDLPLLNTETPPSWAHQIPAMMGSMEQVRRERSSRMRGGQGALANKRAAYAHAHALGSTIRNLMAAGFVSQRALADELNRRGIATARGGKWHRTSIGRVLTRLDLITSGRGEAKTRAADARATALAATIRRLQRAGFVSNAAIARELNLRRIPTAQDSKWHPFGVSRLLERLEKLDRASSSGRHPR
jgi:hypothetical protein